MAIFDPGAFSRLSPSSLSFLDSSPNGLADATLAQQRREAGNFLTARRRPQGPSRRRFFPLVTIDPRRVGDWDSSVRLGTSEFRALWRELRLPQIIQGMGVANLATTFVVAAPMQ